MPSVKGDPSDGDVCNLRAMSIRQLEKLTRFDRNRISKMLSEAGLKWTAGDNRAKLYDGPSAIEVLYRRDEEVSPSDQRNLAQAEKARTETAILKRKYILINEAVQANEMFLNRVREIIDEADIPREIKARFIDLMRERLEKPYE